MGRPSLEAVPFGFCIARGQEVKNLGCGVSLASVQILSLAALAMWPQIRRPASVTLSRLSRPPHAAGALTSRAPATVP